MNNKSEEIESQYGFITNIQVQQKQHLYRESFEAHAYCLAPSAHFQRNDNVENIHLYITT